MKVRQDAWSHEEDLLLAETVLRHIRDGSTQVAAFDEAGVQLNRTSAACGYRWNAEVRKQYTQAIEMAKKQRKEKQRSQQKNMNKQKSENPKLGLSARTGPLKQVVTLDECIQFLENIRVEPTVNLKDENNYLQEKKRELLKENKKLTKKHDELLQKKDKIEKDYIYLMNILTQAQQFTDHPQVKQTYPQ